MSKYPPVTPVGPCVDVFREELQLFLGLSGGIARIGSFINHET